MFGGYPPTAIGYPPTAIGYTPTAIGHTPTAIGYPPTAIGCTPTAIGYPPAAILGRIGHSEFFFFIAAPPAKRTWPWEVSFITELLRWLRALQWTDEPCTVTFIELALDFEEFADRTPPAAPQAKFRGHTLPLQERARVLRLALCTLQRLVKSGTLHSAKVITRSAALVPMGGPALAGWNRRPYFACRSAMIPHME